ncbi:acyl-CoA thioesterase [Nakamurella endophytica]|uniref:Acyl-CoA thioesterase 2 n=1 Tax=Nakamurella endophytica TaxID=1748367 RepID=A0A917SQK5_9ACTN|nr:acyl-CoA thioesterase II [Nakamurella endophytica]GGL90863.1 acyl-CoA thioesterase II [Nakamurella endophytica]
MTAADGGPLLDDDGVPRGQPVLDALVRLLDLERLEEDLFRGVSPPMSPVRVFGGQVAAQALVATGRTVPPDRRVHSLHAYFIRPGDPSVPIVYQVDRTRDGRSFTTRRVVAIQHGKPIFTMSSSFQVDEPGVDHAVDLPAVPEPETLPTMSERLAAADPKPPFFARVPRPFDIRYVEAPHWTGRAQPRPGVRVRVWFRPDGALPDDDLLHVCVLAYLSDLTLLDSVLASHGVAVGEDVTQLASLDHAMWFHRPIRLDDWVLYDTDSPSASGGRGLATGRFFARSGALLATVVQEGLIRVR